MNKVIAEITELLAELIRIGAETVQPVVLKDFISADLVLLVSLPYFIKKDVFGISARENICKRQVKVNGKGKVVPVLN
jgi:hypothetical protein